MGNLLLRSSKLKVRISGVKFWGEVSNKAGKISRTWRVQKGPPANGRA